MTEDQNTTAADLPEEEAVTAAPQAEDQAVKAPEENDAESIYDVFATDKGMERTGIELDYGKLGKIRIARAGGANNRFTKVLEQKTRPYRRQMDADTMDEDVANTLLIEAFAETVVLGWEGIKDRNKQPMPFTRENVIKLFTDLPELFTDVREQAMKAANFRELGVETDSGN